MQLSLAYYYVWVGWYLEWW